MFHTIPLDIGNKFGYLLLAWVFGHGGIKGVTAVLRWNLRQPPVFMRRLMCVDGDMLGWRLPDLAEHLHSVVALVGHVDVVSGVYGDP